MLQLLQLSYCNEGGLSGASKLAGTTISSLLVQEYLASGKEAEAPVPQPISSVKALLVLKYLASGKEAGAPAPQLARHSPMLMLSPQRYNISRVQSLLVLTYLAAGKMEAEPARQSPMLLLSCN